MKKSLMFASAVVAMAFAVSFSSCGSKGCMNINDDKYDAEATVSDETACDPAATDAKFVGNWTFTIDGTNDTYAVNVTDATDDYKITANTDLGLSGVGISPVNVALTVSQDEATAASFNIGNATITNLKLTYKSASSATLSGTISGTGAVDGQFLDNGTK